ncbi:TetR/AcrR family transcriptional regulator [Actinomadura fibrosa]|uniref:TetR/AcrR family transcriptional regulator n=1 Tax=Actinomadura fibrosa TaxID=111802 RepID=A0ABW2XS93_9ACTN|nr:TetR/AcrR family transcriptional regulator [Actinomadura fibrosa]
MEAVLNAAVALLDEAGEPALTFRALAARLGTGVGTIYWYVSNKDELLDRATDHAIGGVLAAVEEQPGTDDPIADLRAMAVTLFDEIVDRPWLTAYFMRNTDVQGNSLRLYEKLGQQTLRLDLTPRQRFHAVSAITGVVIGTAANLGLETPQELLDGHVDRDAYLGRFVEQWRSLDSTEFPFVQQIADEFAGHDDRDQFLAALELTLSGLRLQAGPR